MAFQPQLPPLTPEESYRLHHLNHIRVEINQNFRRDINMINKFDSIFCCSQIDEEIEGLVDFTAAFELLKRLGDANKEVQRLQAVTRIQSRQSRPESRQTSAFEETEERYREEIQQLKKEKQAIQAEIQSLKEANRTLKHENLVKTTKVEQLVYESDYWRRKVQDSEEGKTDESWAGPFSLNQNGSQTSRPRYPQHMPYLAYPSIPCSYAQPSFRPTQRFSSVISPMRFVDGPYPPYPTTDRFPTPINPHGSPRFVHPQPPQPAPRRHFPTQNPEYPERDNLSVRPPPGFEHLPLPMPRRSLITSTTQHFRPTSSDGFFDSLAINKMMHFKSAELQDRWNPEKWPIPRKQFVQTVLNVEFVLKMRLKNLKRDLKSRILKLLKLQMRRIEVLQRSLYIFA
ncbi:hypothetical protein L596_015888 [Steinernema carpocapsae]|uniref:Uncharacterized protein n=1 Tax=Steinernema carpocapsae TaxID=34508 RepID=A0A4V6A391_STECR|nr:hypothetical protein L596_015888 [Steinernema carpocapsae]